MTVDSDQALRDLTRTATIFLMAVDAPDLLQDGRTVEDVRTELQEALSQAGIVLDQVDNTPARQLTRRHTVDGRPRRRR